MSQGVRISYHGIPYALTLHITVGWKQWQMAFEGLSWLLVGC